MLASSLLVLALSALPAFGAPSFENRAVYQYNLYNDGTRGSVTDQADDFGATYHTSAFMSRQGCSTTVSITECYAAVLAADPKKGLETQDYRPYVKNGIGKNQRALLLSPGYLNATGIITHKVRFHIITTYTTIAAGQNTAVTFIKLRNGKDDSDLPATLDVKARTFVGEETSGTVLYVSVTDKDGNEDFPTEFSLSSAVGKTIEVTYTLGTDGVAIDKDGVFVARVSAKFVKPGEPLQQLFSVELTKTRWPKGVIKYGSLHKLIFGADRIATAGQQELKTWFGDYTQNPRSPENPE